MSDLYEISQSTTPLETCPVFVVDDSEFGYIVCGTKLQVRYTRTVLGDDYGEQEQHSVYFDCGHSLQEMESSLSMAEYL